MLMILFGCDLAPSYEHNIIDCITFQDFKCSLWECEICAIVIYIDTRMNAMRVLKNRYSSEYFDNVYKGLDIIRIMVELFKLNNRTEVNRHE